MAKATFVASKKSDDGEKRKVKREKVRLTLAALVGKSFAKMSKAEQEVFMVVMGQALDLLDENGAVKDLGM